MGDREIASLIDGYATVAENKNHSFITDPQVVTDLSETVNPDGSRTYSLEFARDLRFSDGVPITAANYAAWLLLFASPEIVQCGADGSAGDNLLGWSAYNSGFSRTFAGVRVPEEYRLMLTVAPEYADNYFGLYGIFVRPLAMHVWLPEGITVSDSEGGASFSGNFEYETCRETVEAARFSYTDRVCAGAFRLVSYDAKKHEAVLMKNEYYKGTYDGTKPILDSIVYTEAKPETMFTMLKNGEYDIIHGISGKDGIGGALDAEDTGKYKTIRYDGDGYAALLFRCDFGPQQFPEVRRGIAYLLDRESLASEALGEYGEVVSAPYGKILRIYDWLRDFEYSHLNRYEYDTEQAKKCFEESGFILGADGKPYESGVRYREVTETEAWGSSRCIVVDGRLIMPLIVDWCTYSGSQDAPYLDTFIADTDETRTAGLSFEKTVLPYEEYLAYLNRDGSRGKEYTNTTFGMFDIFHSLGTVYDVSDEYTDNYARIAAGSNRCGITDAALAQAAASIGMHVLPGEDEMFARQVEEFFGLYNDLLPEIPLYSSVVVDIFSADIKGYEAGSMKTVAQTVLKCSVGR